MTKRRWLLGVAFAAIAGAVFFARPAATPGPSLRDFEAYWSAGATWNSGDNPYGRAIWIAERTVNGVTPSRDELLPFVGPPPTLLLWSLFARLPYDRAAIIWIAVLVAALLAMVAATLRGSAMPVKLSAFCRSTRLGDRIRSADQRPRTRPDRPSRFCRRGARRRRAFAMARGSRGVRRLRSAKRLRRPVLGIGRNRATFAIVLGVVATYALGAFVAGWSWPLAYARVLAAHAGAERLSAIQITPAAIAYGFGASPAAADVVGTRRRGRRRRRGGSNRNSRP